MAAEDSISPRSPECSSSDRIKKLNDIDTNIVRLLHCAGSAIKALTIQSSKCEDQPLNKDWSIEQRKKIYIDATSQYFTLLSSVDVNLRRQIYALEEANIIAADALFKEAQTGHNVTAAITPVNGTTNPDRSRLGTDKHASLGSGLGSLDIGWLNSRNDKVGREMELELWSKAQDLMTNLENSNLPEKLDDDIDMQHDEVVPISTD